MPEFVRIRPIELMLSLIGVALFILGMIATAGFVLEAKLPIWPLGVSVLGMTLVAIATELRANRLRRLQQQILDDDEDLASGGSRR